MPKGFRFWLSGLMLTAVALFGAIGATVTGVFNLSRASDARIPESTLHVCDASPALGRRLSPREPVHGFDEHVHSHLGVEERGDPGAHVLGGR